MFPCLRANPLGPAQACRSALGRHFDFGKCQNRLGEDEAIPDHQSAHAARIITPDRLAIDPVKIHVLQPGKENLEVEAAPVIDIEIDRPQQGADR